MSPVNDKPQSLQIEVTSRCNLNCTTCVKSYFRQHWHEVDLPLTIYRQLLDNLPQDVKSIHLQGWGEPLLVPQITQYIQDAKAAGLLVNFTTNGTIMNQELAEELIDSGLDGITFSMAGGCDATSDQLRGEGSFELVHHSIRRFMMVKKALASSTPKCAISYLLTPNSVKELPAAVKWCRKVNIDQFSTVHMTQTTNRQQDDLRFQLNKPSSYFNLLRRRAYFNGLFSHMKVDLKQFQPEPTPVCDKNPLQSLFVGSDGSVSPCVFLNPPLGKTKLPWFYHGKKTIQPRLIFGNCTALTIQEIWDLQPYRDFRRRFQKRLDLYNKALLRVEYSLKGPEQLDHALKVIEDGFCQNPPPVQCQSCYKMEGF